MVTALDPSLVAARRERALAVCAHHGASAAVVHDPATLRQLTGLLNERWPAALVLGPDLATLVHMGDRAPLPVDREVVLAPFPADAVRPLPALLREAVAAVLPQGAIGVERATAPGWLLDLLAERGARAVDIGEPLARLRRRKDPDEIAVIERNVQLAAAAYARAAEVVAPGVDELTVSAAMRSAVEEAAGEPVPSIGDYASGPGGGLRGGPPGRRRLVEGDAYVLDFQLGWGGYWADLCRTFAAGTPPAALVEAAGVVEEALRAAESLLAPGTPVSEVDRTIRAVLDARPDLGGAHPHLTGHGLGALSHEPPWIALGSDEVLEPGDVIVVEPGLYGEALNGGIRVEDAYAIEPGGCRRLSAFERLTIAPL